MRVRPAAGGENRNLHSAVYKSEEFKFKQFPEEGAEKFNRILEEEIGDLNLD